MDSSTGQMDGPPEISTRCVLGFENGAGYLGGAQRVITSAVENASAAQRREPALFKEHLRVELKRYIQKQTGAKPVILPVVVET
jgi:ribonuclease J